jgi:cytochrome c oxidase subunit 1
MTATVVTHPADSSGRSFARLALANIATATVAFGVAAAMAIMQALSRANLDLPFRSPDMYYMSVTAHGTLMALVFTTFFIMGFGYVVAQQSLGTALAMRRTAWLSFWIALVGTVFYIGLTLVVVGSWGWALVMLRALRVWRLANPSRRIPLAVYGYAATIIVWLLATIGVAAEMLLQLIPWSLGWSPTIDPVLARMLFWWFGHPLVYFWLIPAYVVWYGLLPPAAGGKLFSEPLGRVVFAMFVLLSTPVGFHH